MKVLKKLTFPTIFLLAELTVILWKITDDLQKGFSFYSWNITELLINYEGGFVRRGLLGQMIYVACQTFSFSPYFTVITICLVSLGIYFFLFFKEFLNKKIPPFIAASVLLAATPVFSGDWVRKDVLMGIFFILIIKCLVSEKKHSSFWAFILLSVGILVHESLFFVAFPATVVLHLTRNIGSKFSFAAMYPLVFPVATFLTVCIFSGNDEVVNAIQDSWNIKDKSVQNAITSLKWTLEFGVRIAFAQGKAFTDNGLIFPPAVWFFVVSSVFYMLINMSIFLKDSGKILKYRKFMLVATLFLLASVSPLFVLGCDYGRWIFYWSSACVATFLFIPEPVVDDINKYLRIKDSFFIQSPIFAKDKTSLYILLMVVAVPGFIMNTENYLNSAVMYHFIIRLSSIFNYFI